MAWPGVSKPCVLNAYLGQEFVTMSGRLSRYLMAVVLAFSTGALLTVSYDAEARRMGGGSSFGRQSSNITSNRSAATPPAAANNATRSAAPAAGAAAAADVFARGAIALWPRLRAGVSEFDPYHAAALRRKLFAGDHRASDGVCLCWRNAHAAGGRMDWSKHRVCRASLLSAGLHRVAVHDHHHLQPPDGVWETYGGGLNKSSNRAKHRSDWMQSGRFLITHSR